MQGWINEYQSFATHGGPSPCETKNIIRSVRTADSTADLARMPCAVPSQNAYFESGLAYPYQLGATTGRLISEAVR